MAIRPQRSKRWSVGRNLQPRHHLLHPLLADVGVNLGGTDALVAEQRLDVHPLGPGVQQVGGVSIPCSDSPPGQSPPAPASPDQSARRRGGGHSIGRRRFPAGSFPFAPRRTVTLIAKWHRLSALCGATQEPAHVRCGLKPNSHRLGPPDGGGSGKPSAGIPKTARPNR